MKKKLIIVGIIILLFFGVIFIKRTAIRDYFYNQQNEPVPEAVSYNEIINENQKIYNINQESPTNQNANININANLPVIPNVNLNVNQAVEINGLPATYNLAVPFTSQAPFANWNAPYQEACEEASILIVHYFYQNKVFTPAVANEEILKMVDWQMVNWGGHHDLTIAQTANLARQYFNYQDIQIISNPTIEIIKEKIYQGLPVIVPTAGRELGNPNFTAPGPLYHMLVIKGWTANNFITSDPGTRKGRDYQYKYATLMSAIHDWNNGDVSTGQAVMLIVK